MDGNNNSMDVDDDLKNDNDSKACKARAIMCDQCPLLFNIGDYLAIAGITFWSSNDELVESCHALLEKRNLKHGFKKTQNLTGEYKKKIARGSLNMFLAKYIRSKIGN